MLAITISQQGGPEVLSLERQKLPRPGPGEVLVKVAYAGINRGDIVQRRGSYPPPPGASDVLGLEIAGHIATVGDGVDETLPGQRVCTIVTGGGYAGYCLTRPEHCLEVPSGLTMAEAAALPEALFTVWHNVFQRGCARDGETLLVHGGTSGIGTMAIKLGKAFGLTMIVTCGTDAKCAAARDIGADHAINYKERDFVADVRAITGDEGAHLVLDVVAGAYTQRNLDSLAVEGRLVTIALQGGTKATIDMAQLMVKRQVVTGSTMRARSNQSKALMADEIAREVWPLVADGLLRPQMDRIFPLADAADAHRWMEAGKHIGKIVLAVEEAQ